MSYSFDRRILSTGLRVQCSDSRIASARISSNSCRVVRWRIDLHSSAEHARCLQNVLRIVFLNEAED